MAANDGDNLLVGAGRGVFRDEPVPRPRPQGEATALVAVLLATALVLPGVPGVPGLPSPTARLDMPPRCRRSRRRQPPTGRRAGEHAAKCRR